RYFGAVKQFLELQGQGQSYVFIADYHSLTSVRDPDQLSRYTQRIALEYLALGLDPERVAVFRQSDVPAVCELAWILSTVTPMGLLHRCHSYKDKTAQGIAPDHGLFAYPVLMAADILIYGGEVVPVGQDQKQHVEVTRDIAIRFNQIYGEVLTIPEPRIHEATAKVPGVDGRKMSSSYGNQIRIFDAEKTIRKQMMGIVTDSLGVEDVKEPEGNTIFELFRLMGTGAQTEDLAARYRAGGMGYGHAKQALFEAFLSYFGKARTRFEELLGDPSPVEAVLAAGAAKARITAEETLVRVRDAVGLSRRLWD
ncbi:MAG: tryptophan--tRNA ligase, partial [Planctomycetota bacterium]